MDELNKDLGIIILLVGVIVLAVTQYMGVSNNLVLLIGLGLIVLGVLFYIIQNRHIN